jgi:hypothetical protein
MSQQFDMNQYNTLVEQASEAIMCDSECRRQNEIEKLKQQYLDAETNMNTAPAQFQEARQNYLTFTQGDAVYSENMEAELQETSQTIADEFSQKFDEDSAKIETQIDTYNGLFLNFKNVFELYEKYKKENIKLFNRLKNETNDVLTNERKTYYEDQQIDNLKSFYFYILLVVYIICVVCFGIFTLKYTTNWSSFIQKIIILVFLIILPFISTFVLGKLINFIYEVYDLLPKNVYK